jgi:hypothetical protein
MASRYGENYEEGFSRRITADDSDEACQAVVDQCAGEYDLDDVLEIRDLWRAINTLQSADADAVDLLTIARMFERYLADNGGDEHFHDADGRGWLTMTRAAIAKETERTTP